MAERMIVVQGDITKQQVDAIVNAANERMRGGGGVDGAIHRAAGPELLEECIQVGGCPTGEARITRGYELPARYVIHTVGPVWHGGDRGEPELLASCYRDSLALAAENGVRTIAFPAISCGVYGYPLPDAVAIAVGECAAGTERHPEIDKIVFACFDEGMLKLYKQELAKVPVAPILPSPARGGRGYPPARE
jgi:O-acetyl-ADP-ribose deacetylase (regulator of RNase III)